MRALVKLANDVNDHDFTNFDCPHLFFELARDCYRRKEPQLAAAAAEALVSCDCILRRDDVSAYVYIPMLLTVAHADTSFAEALRTLTACGRWFAAAVVAAGGGCFVAGGDDDGGVARMGAV